MDQSVANSKKEKVVAALERRNFRGAIWSEISDAPRVSSRKFLKIKEGMKI